MRKLTTDEFIQRARKIHGNKYDYSQVKYKNNRTKVKIICPEHGLFEQIPDSHLMAKGCEECAKEKRRLKQTKTIDEFIKRAREIHSNKYDYSKVKYVNVDTKVKIICPKHGVFSQTPYHHINRKQGCPDCGNEQQANAKRKSLKQFISDAKEKHGDKYDYSKVDYVNTNTKVCIICPEHGEFWQTPSNHLSDKGCDVCGRLQSFETKRKNGTLNTSQPEEDLYRLLCNKFGVDDVIRQYKESRYPFNCDFYIKPLDLFIELNAFWMHGYHWFDVNDEQDLKVLDEWTLKSKHQPMYKSAIDTWIIRDIKKRDTAIQNNLNYKVFWDCNLADATQWLGSI